MLTILRDDRGSTGPLTQDGPQVRHRTGGQGPISTENTTVTTKKDLKRNGSLRYTIRPIKEAVEQHEQKQLQQLELDTARWNAAKAG